MENKTIDLNKTAKELRIDIIDMLHIAKSGHAGGSLSAVEILTALYFQVMHIDPSRPGLEDRDRFILSKGHAAPALYAVLAKLGYFSKSALWHLRQMDSILQGHPDMKKTPGVDFSSGSLGQGLSVGCGIAWGLQKSGIKARVFVLLGDGELNEGQVWEAAMTAAKLKLDNLVAIIDINGVQLDGKTEDIMPLGDISAKWSAFGWKTASIDGHDITQITDALDICDKGYPRVILARTVKGKGVSFMENDYQWHGKPINDDEYHAAIAEINAIG